LSFGCAFAQQSSQWSGMSSAAPSHGERNRPHPLQRHAGPPT
jgi:hypothetical protein